MIRFSTAKLFEASARLGAVLAEARSRRSREACADYGRSLATAFQLVDDLLDYEGATTELGKNVGDDLREGKAHLPLLVAMARGSEAERALIRGAIQHGEVARRPRSSRSFARRAPSRATRQAARARAEIARQCAALPPSDAREALLELCVRSVERSSSSAAVAAGVV